MCGGCRPTQIAVDWYSSGAGETPVDRRQARMDLARASSRLFAGVGQTVTVDQAVAVLVVRNATGVTQLVSGFNALARTPERSGRIVDPLSDEAIEAVRKWDAARD